MCGIAATVDLHGRGRAAPFALEFLRHRGPDGEGVVESSDRNVALEHCRLAIIDPNNPEANQPFSDPTGRWTIVYNGELFNFMALRRELEQRGVAFRTRSDTEVVLLGFIHDGDQILDRLRGMFAFVVWDRETNEIFAARDQVGVKPLYYTVSNGVFRASSEVRPLLRAPARAPGLDAAGAVEFLAFGGNFGETTLVEGIKKLLPGHCLRITGSHVQVREYWDVLPAERRAPAADDAASELLTELDEAVSAALVSDVPLGLMLSGGIDSSTIAALAVRHVDAADLTAYTVAFGRPDDETTAAARLAGDLGIELRTVLVTEDEIRGGFDAWLADLDYPLGNATAIASSSIASAAHADGIKVLLSGDGGDELFGGYNRWMRYLRFHDCIWRRAPRRLRRLGGRVALPLARGLGGDIARRAAVGGELFVPSRPWHDDLLSTCLGPAGVAAAAAVPVDREVGRLRRQFEERAPGADYLAWMAYAALKLSLVEDYLQRLDKMGMRHSVEGRVPLLDPQLTRWAFRVPQELMVPGFKQKTLLRRAVAPILPGYVLDRPKQGFCPPTADWAAELMSARVASIEGPLVDQGILVADAGARALRQGAHGSFAVWTLGTLADWSRRNLGAETAHELEAVAR